MAEHKHAFVGKDQEGTSCIYVLHIDSEGTTGDFFSSQELQKIADRINNMKGVLAA